MNGITYVRSPKSYELMQIAATSALSCSVFGHNLVRTSERSHKLTCKTCNTLIAVDDDGSFDDSPIHNQDIKYVLQQLFLLKQRYRPNMLID